ncbi:Translation initiation factor eIF-2B subunit delta [Linum grandiflorum]
MDPRRGSLPVPRVRQVGFFAPNAAPLPARSQSGPPDPSSPPLSDSPASNSLSPVMIPPARHNSDSLAHRPSSPLPVPEPSHFGRRGGDNGGGPVVGSYNPAETLLGMSPPPTRSPSTRVGDGEFADETATSSSSPGWFQRSNSAKLASSLPIGSFDFASVKSAAENLVPVAQNSVRVSEKAAPKQQTEAPSSSSKQEKPKQSKAERRALQEAQRAAKAALKATGGKAATVSEGVTAAKPAKQQQTHKKDASQAAASVAPPERKGGSERSQEKERRKDALPPRMQYDDKGRVEKAKRRAVVNQTEARNRVELFRHLPQYEHGTELADLEAKLLQHPMHPAIYKVGLQYLAGDIAGGNARCIAMLQAFQDFIRDYSTPPEKVFTRDLTAKISSQVSFFTECRPLSMSMGNAIRFLKNRIAKLPLSLSESEAKASLCDDIDRFITEKIVLAARVIVSHAITKVKDGDVLLVYGSSCVVEMILLQSHELGKKFRVIVVDSRPKLEGKALVRRLVNKGLQCTYTHINAVSYVMHQVTKVFLGASSILSNGTVYSRVGTACVAMVAHAFRIPVIICCEAYKFHERVQIDSICSNELGDPDAIAKVPGRTDINYLNDLSKTDNLQLLNLMYDATPSDYVSMIITDYGMIPPTSVAVIVRECLLI